MLVFKSVRSEHLKLSMLIHHSFGFVLKRLHQSININIFPKIVPIRATCVNTLRLKFCKHISDC